MSGYRSTVVAIALVTIALGIAILAIGLAEGGAVGIVLGLLFVGAGAARLYLARKRGQR